MAVRARPKALLLENVPNLLRVDNGHALHIIMHALTTAGYHCRLQLANAAALLPQHRERLYIAAFRELAAADAFRWPSLPVGRASQLRELIEPLQPEAAARYELSSAQWSQVRDSLEFRQVRWGGWSVLGLAVGRRRGGVGPCARVRGALRRTHESS